MRPMVLIWVLIRAAAIALVLVCIWAVNAMAALGVGMFALLFAAVAGLRQNPPLFRWPASVALSGVFSGLLLWTIYDNSPLLVRVHNAGDQTVSVALTVTNRDFPLVRLAPGADAWRMTSMVEGSILLSCEDSQGPQSIVISGYVTNGEAQFDSVELPTCRSARVAEHRFGS